MILRKLDEKLYKILTLDSKNDQKDEKNELECLIYSNNLPVLKRELKKMGIEVLASFPFIGAVAVKLPKDELLRLTMKNYISYISSQSTVFAMMNVSRKVLKLRQSKAKNKVTIAFIDTGINEHLDFSLPKRRIIKFLDLVNGGESPYDDNGHGTFVAGAASGNGFASGEKFKGVAPKADIISIKALDSSGEASASRILSAMQWVYDNDRKYNIKVVCMSFGSEPLGLQDPIMKGAEALWQKGIAVVSAAGNSGPMPETIKSPGVSQRIITVGGLDDKREGESFNRKNFMVADFSSRGPAFQKFKPDLIAPSVFITSCAKDGGYASLSGTSVATPMVAGLIALAYEQNKNFPPDYLKRALLASCEPITRNRNLEGFGLPNADKFFTFLGF